MSNCCPPVGGAPVCPIVDAPTKLVSRDTVGRHVVLPKLPETIFGFCDNSDCDVVYVGNDGTLIRKHQPEPVNRFETPGVGNY